MNAYGFELLWSDEDEGYIATCPDFPGLSAFGATPDKALKEAHVALQLFIDEYVHRGEPLPTPTKIIGFSGQTRLRLPKDLHAQLASAAAKSGVSLNTYLVSLLSGRNAIKEMASELMENMRNSGKNNVVHHHHHYSESIVIREEVLSAYDQSEKGDYHGKVTYNN